MIYRTILGYLTRKAIIAPKPWDPQLEPPYKSVQSFGQEHAQTLTHASLQSLHNYGYVGHWAINEHLRGENVGKDKIEEVEEHIHNIDEAMDRSFLNSDIIVWRGMPARIQHPLNLHLYRLNAIQINETITRSGTLNVINDGNLKKAIGFTFTEPGYISTTLNSDVNLIKTAPIALRIRVEAGQHAIYMNAVHALVEGSSGPNIKEFRGFRAEHEVLLDRGMTFKVTNIQSNKKDQVIVSLEVV